MISRPMWLIVYAAAALCAHERAIDVQRSTITIHVGKAGLLSVAGHEHWVEAPISSGIINELDPARVEFRVATATMRVKPDPKVDAKAQSEIQRNMQEKVLECAKFPEILFRSFHVEKQAECEWRVQGVLMLHGATNPISILVKRSGDRYVGRTTLQQTDFGITPITAAGGMVKVKNELEIEFSVLAIGQ
jgi:polyisoprenoid-binding protein YceI